MPQEHSAGVVVFRKPSRSRFYLLLHYEAGHWDFPKGNVEEGETEEQAAARECAEETGITDIAFVPGFREKIEYFYRREGETIHKRVDFFLAGTKTEKVKISYEHIGSEWLPYRKALERLTYPNARQILGKAEGFLAKKG